MNTHSFVLNKTASNQLELAASVYEATSGRYMEVWTILQPNEVYTHTCIYKFATKN